MSTKSKIAKRIKELQRHRQLFNKGQEEISDVAYDTLVEELRSWDPKNPFFQSFNKDDLKGNVVTHSIPMLSTRKAYKTSVIENWVKSVIKEAKAIGIKSPTFRVTPKLDGIAGQYKDGTLATRGNGKEGNNISYVFKDGVTFKGKRVHCVGEVVAVNSYFYDEIYPAFKNPRSMVAGYVSSDTIHPKALQALKAHKIHFVPFTTLPDWKGTGAELIKNIGNITENLRKRVDYPLDGMVAAVVQEKLRKAMGATDNYKRWQLAIKQRGEVAETVVNEIVWQTGKTGKVTPVLRIKPVVLDGATLSNVTASNAQKVKDDGLGVGAKIVVTRSGGVIPALVEVKKKASKVVLPTHCSSCNHKISLEGDFLMCSNTKCGARTSTGLFYFFKTIETAKGFGPKTIQLLIENGYTSLQEIFSLDKDTLEDIGFGPGQAKNLVAAMKEALKTEIEDARFLAAFALEKLAIGTARQLLENFAWEDLPNLTAEQIEALKGFGDSKAAAIVAGIEARWSEIEGLRKVGFKLQKTKAGNAGATKADTPISGKQLRFTGKMASGSRSDMEKQARAMGAKVVKSVSKKLDYLVYGSDAGSALTKAQDLGIDLLTEEAYLKLIKAHV